MKKPNKRGLALSLESLLYEGPLRARQVEGPELVGSLYTYRCVVQFLASDTRHGTLALGVGWNMWI
jgi:hypothetical protein